MDSYDSLQRDNEILRNTNETYYFQVKKLTEENQSYLEYIKEQIINGLIQIEDCVKLSLELPTLEKHRSIKSKNPEVENESLRIISNLYYEQIAELKSKNSKCLSFIIEQIKLGKLTVENDEILEMIEQNLHLKSRINESD